ncbi:MAG TPA: dienelactone hydrolase family protein [Alphaproteobacteria bacterium]|nr:dienelactone hydrolase family protein [Alphaproteobacteria bacterium]
MGKDLTLSASDGHEFGAYRADPAGTPKGGIVVIQEIFGVNKHIREVCDGFAADGYAALAPSLYDRSSRRNFQAGYTPEDIEIGRKLREEFAWDDAVKDVKAAVDVLRGDGLKVGSVGYCWGGTISYLAGTRLDVDCAVVYYGGQIIPFVDEKARCPMLMHFGEHDKGIPLSDVDKIRAAHPEAAIHVYPADHGFNCDHRGSYHAESAREARARTLAFFASHLGG